MSYLECPGCGQKALAVATRCPRCGRPLDSGQMHVPPASRPRRLPFIVLLAAVVIGLVALNAIRGGFRSPAHPPVNPAGLLPPKAADTSLAASVPPPEPKPSFPAAASVAAPPPAAAPETEPSGLAATAAGRRYASTWVNVHTGRSGQSPVLRVLRPGEPIVAVGPVRGWYLILPDSGFVDAHYLRATAPAGSSDSAGRL